MVCKDTIQDIAKARRSRPGHRKYELGCQVLNDKMLCRAYGFYYTLLHKLYGRISKRSFPVSFREIAFSVNTPVSSQIYCDGDYLDLDSVTLKNQLESFTNRENAAQKELVKLVDAIDKSKRRPTILRRGMSLPSDDLSESQELQGPKASEIAVKEAVKHLIQNCLTHLGDLARYESQIQLSTSFYTSALYIDPTSGHPFNQMGVIYAADSCFKIDNAIASYIRAIACENSSGNACFTLKRAAGYVARKTETVFSKFLRGVSLEKNFCVALLSPFMSFFRFCSVILANLDDWVIVTATKEFSTSVNALLAIIFNKDVPSELPKDIADNVSELKLEYSKLKALPLLADDLRKLQLRFFNTVVVYSFGLHSNFLNEKSSVARQCILHAMTSMINWFAAAVKAVHEKNSIGSDSHLPLAPLLTLILAIKHQITPQLYEEEHQPLSNKEVLKFAPPLCEDVINVLNSLAKVSKPTPREDVDLEKINLPEIYALQGFEPIGIPAFSGLFQSGPYEELMPASFFSQDEEVLADQHRKRVSFLINNLMCVAESLPSLLQSIGSKKRLKCVQREFPSLPNIDAPTDLKKYVDPKKIAAANAPALEESKVVNKSEKTSSPERVVSRSKMDGIDTEALARFMEAKQRDIDRRIRESNGESAEENSSSKSSIRNHGYSTSRAANNNNRNGPPRFSKIHLEMARRSRPGHRKYELGCQVLNDKMLCRAYGFYYTLLHKLYGRISKRSFPVSFREIAFSVNTPVSSQIYCDGDYLDLDSVTLKNQLESFTNRENAAQKELVKLVDAIDKSKRRPTILRRGMSLPSDDLSESQELQGPKASEIAVKEAVKHLIQNCLTHLGDLARYESQIQLSTSFYTSALYIDPTSGHPFNQMGVIYAADSCFKIDNAIASYIRAIACENSSGNACFTLKRAAGYVARKTETVFSKFLRGVSLEKNFCVALLSPFMSFFRFCSVILANLDDWVIVTATKEFSTSVNALLAIIFNKDVPSELPKDIADNVSELKLEYSKLKALPLLADDLRKLQLRFFNTVVVYSFGLHSNFLNEKSSVARQCILHAMTSMINWFAAAVKAVHEKNSIGSDSHLPLAPLLTLILAIKHQITPQLYEEEHQPLSNKEVLKFAPPLCEDVINVLNSLAKVSKPTPREDVDLEKINLPEIYALQGFEPIGIPAFSGLFQSGPYEELMPASFFSQDEEVLADQHRKRVSFLINNLMCVAESLPSLLQSIGSKKRLKCVQREFPSLPNIDAPTDLKKYVDPKKIAAANAPALEESKVVNKSEKTSSPERVVSRSKMDGIDTEALARFMEAKQRDIDRRIRESNGESAEENSSSKSSIRNHGYSTSRAANNNNRNGPPRFSKIHLEMASKNSSKLRDQKRKNSNRQQNTDLSDQTTSEVAPVPHYPQMTERQVRHAGGYHQNLPPPRPHLPFYPGPPRMAWSRHPIRPQPPHHHPMGPEGPWYPMHPVPSPYGYPMPPPHMPYMAMAPYQHNCPPNSSGYNDNYNLYDSFRVVPFPPPPYYFQPQWPMVSSTGYYQQDASYYSPPNQANNSRMNNSSNIGNNDNQKPPFHT
nr:hypothetical transcript [Hymenolepis microstoma]